MTLVMVSRQFDEAIEFDDIQAKENAGSWCLDLHRVHFIRTYFSLDRRRMLCLYEAPDAEAVRVAQRTIEMPVEHVWPVTVLSEMEDDARAIVVERTFDQPMSLELLDAAVKHNEPCFATHRTRLAYSFVGTEGRSTACVFEAADAESVRIANRQAGLPAQRVWPATIHRAAAGSLR